MTSRERILEAAWKLCDEHGVDRLTMRGIGAKAGVTAPAIYRHFAGKSALVQALVDQANQRLAGHLRTAGTADEPWPRLQATIEALLDFALDDPTSYDILYLSRGRTDPELTPYDLKSPNFRLWLERIEACRQAGVLRGELDAVEMALVIWAQIQGLVTLHLQGRFGGSTERLRYLVRRGLEQLLEGIAP